MALKVAIAADHGGFQLKTILMDSFRDVDVEWLDLGTHSTDSVDYPEYGQKIAEAVASGEAQFGVAICGSGIGISIAANRNPQIRCALCTDETMARLSRQHNDANIVAIGARIIGDETARAILKQFLSTPFEGGRHAKRVDQLSTC